MLSLSLGTAAVSLQAEGERADRIGIDSPSTISALIQELR